MSEHHLVRRPGAALTVPNPSDLAAGFPDLRLTIFPAKARIGDAVHIRPFSTLSLAGCEWRPRLANAADEPWRPVEAPYVVRFQHPGEVVILAQVRRGSAETVVGGRVEVLHDLQGQPGPGEPRSAIPLPGGEAILLICTDGAMYHNLRSGESYILRNVDGASQQAATPGGKLVTHGLSWRRGPGDAVIFFNRGLVHDLFSGTLLGEFTLEPGERLGGVTPTEEVIALGVRLIDPAYRYHGVIATTRLVEPLSGTTVTAYDGTLVGVAGRTGVVLAPDNTGHIFLADYRDALSRVNVQPYVPSTTAPYGKRTVLSADGAFLAVAGSRMVGSGGRTIDVPVYDIALTRSASRLLTLDAKRVECFADSRSCWISDHREARLDRAFRLYDFESDTSMPGLPAYGLARDHGLVMNQPGDRWCVVGADPRRPDFIVGVGSGSAFVLKQTERWSRLHTIHRQGYPGQVLASGRRVYYSLNSQPVRGFDPRDGKPVGELPRGPIRPTAGGRRRDYFYVTGPFVFTGNTGIPIEWWGYDDRNGRMVHWVAPDEIIEARALSADDDATVLFSGSVGDREHGIYTERHTDALLGAALGAVTTLAGGSAGSSQAEALPADKWGNHPPPRQQMLAIWNTVTNKTRTIVLGWSAWPVYWSPDHRGWLLERSLPDAEAFDESGRVIAATHLRTYYLLSREGDLNEILQLPVPAEVIAPGQVRNTQIILSRATPGEVVIANRATIGGYDLFRREFAWQYANPLPRDAQPGPIVPLGRQQVCAKHPTGGWLVIAGDGRVTDVWPVDRSPSVEGGVILQGGGFWRLREESCDAGTGAPPGGV